MDRNYKCLNNSSFCHEDYEIVPIRDEDRYLIMRWRNEQIYHLRQSVLLDKKAQDDYFHNVVAKLFNEKRPGQILFSYLEKDKCIGYGGLVHINWVDKNAEISFLMETKLEEAFFEFHWINFLKLIEKVAFNQLLLHKIYTYAFDLRPRLYKALDKSGFYKEAELKEHCLINEKYHNVIIHAKIEPLFFLREATINDKRITFNWAEDPKIRQYSFNKGKITWLEHDKWFNQKLSDNKHIYLILSKDDLSVGSIRFEIDNGCSAMISYLIDSKFHGRGYGRVILELGVNYIKKKFPYIKSVYGYVEKDNVSSSKVFERLGYIKHEIDLNRIFYKKYISNEDNKF